MKRTAVLLTLLALLAVLPLTAGAEQTSRGQLLGARKQFAVVHTARTHRHKKTTHRRKTKRKTKKTGTGTTGTGTGTSGTGTPTTTTGTPTTTGPTTSADPSGIPIPTGSPAGWTEDFADDFTQPSFSADPAWTAYSGAPAGQSNEGWWEPSHDMIANGELQLRGYQDPLGYADGALAGSYVTGGVETTSFSQTYGKYLVRFRMAQGQGIAFSTLLWPISNGTHDEIDFAEDNGADPRAWNTATIHYGPDNTKVVNALQVDMTQWHTLGVEWSPGAVVYTIDGRSWARVTGANIPALAMRLDLQTQAWRCGSDPWEQCVDASTPNDVNMEVDWVVAYGRS